MPTGIYQRTQKHRANISLGLRKANISYDWMRGKKLPSETRLKMSKSQLGHVGYWKNKVYPLNARIKISDALKGRKKTKIHLKNNLRSSQKNLNKNELLGMEYLDYFYKNKFQYCGNGDLIIDRFCPDAVSYELKTVVLFHGIYFHLLIYGLENSEENKYIIEQVDKIPFNIDGWRVIILWEDELKIWKNKKMKGEVYVID